MQARGTRSTPTSKDSEGQPEPSITLHTPFPVQRESEELRRGSGSRVTVREQHGSSSN